MIERFYYTLDEMLDDEVLAGFKKLFDTFGIAFTDTSYTTELFNHIDEAYGQDYIAYIDIQHPVYEFVDKPSITEVLLDDGMKYQMMQFVKKVKGWLDDSQFRYEKLISLYTNQQNNLLNKLESTVQFNDTPQTTSTGLDDDDYATTYTKSSTDVTTIMSRLQEVRSYWSSLYNEWSNEFSKKFVLYI